jgi:hypothetical protein
MRLWVIVPALLCVAVAAVSTGCGGSSQTFTETTTLACLEEEAGVTDINTRQSSLDYVAQDAAEGAMEVEVSSGNTVAVLFEGTSNDAQRTSAAYGVFAEAFDSPVDDILDTRSNVVLLWERTPSDDERNLVAGCLREDGQQVAFGDEDDSVADTHVYPTDFTTEFMAGCTGSATTAQCQCVLDDAQERFSLYDFMELVQARGSEYDAITAKCR